MSGRITVEPAGRVPPTATVRHYDELPEAAKHRLPSLVEGDRTRVEDGVAADLAACDYVKFTRYYRITAHRAGSAGG